MQKRKSRAAKMCAEHTDGRTWVASVITSMKGSVGAGVGFSIQSIQVVKASGPQRVRVHFFFFFFWLA